MEKIDTKWYETTFDEFYLKAFEPLRPEIFTTTEVDAFINHLNLPEGSRILDLGCGYGRHSIELAKRGYDVVGVDLSETLLNRAISDAKKLDVNVEFIQLDMRKISFENEFDAVINNSFGYLENDDQELMVLKQIKKALKEGGLLLQWELPNRECWSQNFQRYNVISDGDQTLIRENKFDPLTSLEHQLFMFASKSMPIITRNVVVRIFTLTESVKMYKEAGLEYVKHSALSGSEMTFKTDSMLIISKT